ncbi:hypothetical protein Sjap_024064 [Stephania japonica]|uniref:Rx N-terminal domain-containing protein n=1 Tax=Stephania japonica TaxID=461633 RepID=A0AAP0EHI5_9MAGN
MGEEIVVGGVEEVVKRLVSLGIDEIRLLHGVKEEVEKLQTILTHIQLVLQDADKKQVGDESVSLWLQNLKEAALDAEDILVEFTFDGLRRQVLAKTKVLNFFPCFTTLSLNLKTAHSIQNISMRLEDIDKRKGSFHFNIDNTGGENVISNVAARETSSLVDELDVVGRETEKVKMVDMLINGFRGSSCSTSATTLSIVTILGLAGLGKMTLAQLVFNDDSVKEHFGSMMMMMWVCVS